MSQILGNTAYKAALSQTKKKIRPMKAAILSVATKKASNSAHNIKKGTHASSIKGTKK